jgi:hypothetical protein
MKGDLVERRGERVIAVRWVNGRGKKVFASKGEACRQLHITMKKLDKCLEGDGTVLSGGERWYLDVLVEPEARGKKDRPK